MPGPRDEGNNTWREWGMIAISRSGSLEGCLRTPKRWISGKVIRETADVWLGNAKGIAYKSAKPNSDTMPTFGQVVGTRILQALHSSPLPVRSVHYYCGVRLPQALGTAPYDQDPHKEDATASPVINSVDAACTFRRQFPYSIQVHYEVRRYNCPVRCFTSELS